MMAQTVLQVTLKDPVTDATIQATIEADEHGINIGFDGYGDYASAKGFGRPVFIEFRDGKLTVHVWTDISREDPTHVLHMENARENRRIPDPDLTRQQEPDSILIEIEGEPARSPPLLRHHGVVLSACIARL